MSSLSVSQPLCGTRREPDRGPYNLHAHSQIGLLLASRAQSRCWEALSERLGSLRFAYFICVTLLN